MKPKTIVQRTTKGNGKQTIWVYLSWYRNNYSIYFSRYYQIFLFKTKVIKLSFSELRRGTGNEPFWFICHDIITTKAFAFPVTVKYLYLRLKWMNYRWYLQIFVLILKKEKKWKTFSPALHCPPRRQIVCSIEGFGGGGGGGWEGGMVGGGGEVGCPVHPFAYRIIYLHLFFLWKHVSLWKV